MSFRLFDLEPIYRRIECIAEVSFNDDAIALCFQECGFGPREIKDDPYWKEYIKYIYHLHTQRVFNFPDLMIATKSKDLLNIQLARIRFDMLPTETAAEEYKEIWKLASAAVLPELKLKNEVGIDYFDYFVCDYNAKKITFVWRSEKFSAALSDEEAYTFKFIEDRLGPENALDPINRLYIADLPFPKNIMKGDEATKQVYTDIMNSHKKVDK